MPWRQNARHTLSADTGFGRQGTTMGVRRREVERRQPGQQVSENADNPQESGKTGCGERQGQ